MATKIHNGFKVPGKGLSTTAIMSLFAEKIIKGDHDPIEISSLCSLTAETRENVIEDLQFLCEKGWLKIANGDWEEAGSIRIERFQVQIGIDQRTLPNASPSKPDTSSPTVRREETNKDVVKLGDLFYYGLVEYEAETHPAKFHLVIWGCPGDIRDTAGDFDPEAGSLDFLFSGDFAERRDGWREFDNFISKDARDVLGEMLFEEADGTIWKCEIRPDAHEDDVPTGQGEILNISKREPGTEAFVEFAGDQIFDTRSQAWEYVDEFLAAPPQAEPDVSAARRPWETDLQPNFSGEVQTKKHGTVLYEIWFDWADGFDWFRFHFPGDREHTIGYNPDNVPRGKTPLEKFIKSYLDGLTEVPQQGQAPVSTVGECATLDAEVEE